MEFADFVPHLAKIFDIDPASLIFWLGFLTFIANTTARLIPQDATGWQGNVRKAAAIIGVYVPSRVSHGVSVTDVAKAVVASKVEDIKHEVIEAAAQAPALIPEILEEKIAEAQKVVPAFPGLVGMVFEPKVEEEIKDVER